MSISIGFYDLFAYTLPGVLYIFVFLDFSRKLGILDVRLSNLPALPDGWGLIALIMILAIAHLLGQLLDVFARWFVFRLFKPYKFSERTLQRSKDLHTDIDIQFQPKDWGILFSMLRMRNQDHARTIDTFQAYNIMMRNISFGLFLLACLQTYTLFFNLDLVTAAIAITLFSLSIVARRRSQTFQWWFLTDIFESSLKFGSNLKDVIAYDQRIDQSASVSSKKRRTKKA